MTLPQNTSRTTYFSIEILAIKKTIDFRS